MNKVTIRKIGNSQGVILSSSLLQELNLRSGDALFVTKTANGLELRPYDPEHEKQLEIAKQIMRENRSVLKKLAE